MGVQVAVVGAINLDFSAASAQSLIPHDSNPGHICQGAGGVGRNIAENLVRLGFSTCLVSVVGDDLPGQDVLANTQAAGVDVQGVSVLAGHKTATYLSVHDASGDMVLAINDMAILEQLQPALIQPSLAQMNQASVWVTDCNLPENTLQFLLCEQMFTPIFVDAVSAAKCRRIIPWLGRIHTLKCNGLEAQALTGLAVESPEQACAAAQQLHRAGVRQVVVSLGALGVSWCDLDGITGHQAASDVKVLNTSGAGDALMAGLVAAHLQNWPLAAAVAFGMACADITLEAAQACAPALSWAWVQSRMNLLA